MPWPNFMKGVGANLSNPSEASYVPILYGFLDWTGVGRQLVSVLSVQFCVIGKRIVCFHYRVASLSLTFFKIFRSSRVPLSQKSTTGNSEAHFVFSGKSENNAVPVIPARPRPWMRGEPPELRRDEPHY